MLRFIAPARPDMKIRIPYANRFLSYDGTPVNLAMPYWRRMLRLDDIVEVPAPGTVPAEDEPAPEPQAQIDVLGVYDGMFMNPDALIEDAEGEGDDSESETVEMQKNDQKKDKKDGEKPENDVTLTETKSSTPKRRRRKRS